jgi:peroxiredoxin
VVLITVNDPFVTKAWADASGAEGKVKVLADPFGEVTKALGTEWEGSAALLGTARSIRFSAVVQDDVIKTFNAEDGGGLTCSLSNQIIAQLKSA